MKTTLFALIALAIGQVALAQSIPVIKYGQCPTGTYSSSGSCVPRGNVQVFVNGDGPCPAGWTRSARYYCVR
jgi:hypothetical protein